MVDVLTWLFGSVIKWKTKWKCRWRRDLSDKIAIKSNTHKIIAKEVRFNFRDRLIARIIVVYFFHFSNIAAEKVTFIFQAAREKKKNNKLFRLNFFSCVFCCCCLFCQRLHAVFALSYDFYESRFSFSGCLFSGNIPNISCVFVLLLLLSFCCSCYYFFFAHCN